MDSLYPELITKTARYLKDRDFIQEADAAVILGSGLGDFTKRLENSQSIPYEEIPGFPQTSVVGHSGSLFTGTINNKTILAFASTRIATSV